MRFVLYETSDGGYGLVGAAALRGSAEIGKIGQATRTVVLLEQLSVGVVMRVQDRERN
jgi:hypothetical protein